MRGRDFAKEIANAIQGDESVDDVATMIDLLAGRRAQASEPAREPGDRDYFFASTILCILLEPIKPSAYRQDVRHLRMAYKGIESDREKQDVFSQSFSSLLLHAENVEEAVQNPVEALFIPVFVSASA